MNDIIYSYLEKGKDGLGREIRYIKEENLPDLVDRLKEQFSIPVVAKRNWFEKLPLHWRLLYYFVGGIIIGLLLSYVC